MPSDPSDTRSTWFRILAWVIMLPIGIIALLILFAYSSFAGGYVPGEFFTLIVIIFVAVFVVRVLFWRSRRRYWSRRVRDRDPAAIARERYARGELTKEEFDRMMQDLEQQS
jgi:putative membrane protein